MSVGDTHTRRRSTAVWCGQTCWDVRNSRVEGALTFFWASCRVSSENSLWMTSGRRSSQEVGKMLAGSQRTSSSEHERSNARETNTRETTTTVSALLCVADAGQSKCRVERNQALEQARRPQESMFIPECNEDGTFAQVQHIFPRQIFFFPFPQPASCQNQLDLMPLYSYENILLFLSAGPVPHANWLLLVCHQ